MQPKSTSTSNSTQDHPCHLLAQDIQYLSGPKDITFAATDVIVLVRIKNGIEYVASFIEHYLQLGVKHLFFLDNGSTDGTLAQLAQYNAVSVLQTRLPYRAYKMVYYQFLVERYGKKCWNLLVDIDEYFDYPCSAFISLPTFINYLDQYRYQAVIGQMLDLFPAEIVLEQKEVDRKNPFRNHTFYQLADISKHHLNEAIQKNEWANYQLKTYRGGIRKKHFGLDQIELSKFSLIRYSPTIIWESIHRLHPFRVADISAVLYHYKFRPNFKAYIKQAVNEGSYNRNSAAYRQIQQRIANLSVIQLAEANDHQSPDTLQLITQGFLTVSAAYLKQIQQLLAQALSTTRERSKQEIIQAQYLQLGQLLIDQLTKAEQPQAKQAQAYHQELNMEINKLKNTRSWKLGNAFISRIKHLSDWISQFRK